MNRRNFLRNTLMLVAGTSVTVPAFHLLGPKLPDGLAPSTAIAAGPLRVYSVKNGGYTMTEKVKKSPDEWRKLLTQEQYRILREKGTERSFTGKYDKHYIDGIYQCAGCGLDLYSSRDKFNSGTGWPSFSAPIAEENISTENDVSFFMQRTELLCARCDGHLGHVFNDGPKPTGQRHCINSASLTFVSTKEEN